MADLFKEIIPSILQTKECVINTTEDLNDYVPYVVNKALSYHIDCILYANEMNMHGSLDRDMQYQYLLNTVKSRKREFKPWMKIVINNDIQCIKDYFGYSDEKAKDVLRMLSGEQIAEIKAKTDKGGIRK